MFIPTYTFILFWVETDKQIRFFHLKLDSYILISSQAYKNKQVFKQKQEYLYFIPKITTYTLIQFYSFISFQENFPPIRLFRPILLFFFEKNSYLYVYSVLYVYQFSKKNPAYTFIRNRRLFGTLEQSPHYVVSTYTVFGLCRL